MTLTSQTKGFQKLAVSTSAVSLTIPADAFTAYVQVETDSIRYRTDGTAPTSTDGTLAYPGQVIEITEYEQLKNFKAIQADVASGAGQLNIEYHYKQ